MDQVQFCLTDKAGAAELKRTLQSIAADEGLDYFDWSGETGDQLRSVGAADWPDVKQSFPVMNLGVRRKDGLGFGGGNIGFPANQVAFGFTGGNDKEASALMQRVTARLRRTWDVKVVPGRQGMFPLDCP